MNATITCPITGDTGDAYVGTHTARVDVDADCLLPDVGWMRVYVEIVVPRQSRQAPLNWSDPQVRDRFREVVAAAARQNNVILTDAELEMALSNLVFQAQAGYNIGKAIKECDDAERRELLRVVFPPIAPNATRKVLDTLSSIGFVLPPELEP